MMGPRGSQGSRRCGRAGGGCDGKGWDRGGTSSSSSSSSSCYCGAPSCEAATTTAAADAVACGQVMIARRSRTGVERRRCGVLRQPICLSVGAAPAGMAETTPVVGVAAAAAVAACGPDQFRAAADGRLRV
jgi:hypothetical protein